MIGEAEGRRYFSVSDMRRAESLRAMFDDGVDLYGRLVRRGRELGLGVYASIRMNDNHFWSDKARRAPPLKPEEMAATERPHLTAFRKSHPEWVLGEGAPAWAATSWNMAVPEVREYTLRRIAEACELADWDGVELDWERHAFHLPEEDAWRLRYTLTDLHREVRRIGDAIAGRRGRPFFVIVRVGATRETNRRVGYDLEAWIEEGLCDIVVTGANSGTDPGVEVEAYLEMMRGTQVRLYPGFDSHGEWGQGHLLPAGQLAGGLVPRPGRRLLRARRLGRASVQLAQPRAHRAAAAAEPRRARHPAAHGQGPRRREAPHPRPERAALRRRAGRPARRRGARRPAALAGGRRTQVPRRRVRGRAGGRGPGAAGRSRPPVAAGPGRRGAGRAAAGGAGAPQSGGRGCGESSGRLREHVARLAAGAVPDRRKGVHEVRIDLLERDPRLRPPVVVGNVEIHVSRTRDPG